MDTKDKTAPAAILEQDLSAEEKAIKEAEALRSAEASKSATTDDELPKVQTEYPV